MENKLHKRILSAVLAVLILFGCFPVSGVHAEEVANPYAGNKGGTAQFNPALYDETYDSYTYAYLTDDPAKGLNMSTEHTLSPEGLFDLQMIILDVYASAEGYWYKVGAAQGHTLPDALVAMPWVYQNELSDNSYYPDTLLVTPPAVEPSEPSEPSEPEDQPLTDPATGVSVVGVPEDAEIAVSNYSSAAGSGNVGIYDIKVKDANGNDWQPAPGETVRVSIPAFAGTEKVDVVHFLEDPEIINWALANGKAQKVDISGAQNEEKYYILEPAVKAYQAATGSSDICVAAEVFFDSVVKDGYVAVDACGFSAFTSVPPKAIVEAEAVFPDYSWDMIVGATKTNTYSVRPGEWIKINGTVIYGDIEVKSGKDYVSVIDPSKTSFLGATGIYVHINDDAALVGQSVTLQIGSLGRYIKLNIVPDFDYGNVYIGVVGHDSSYPSEVALHANAKPDYYLTTDNTLVAEGTYSDRAAIRNRLYPKTLIEVDALEASHALISNETMTVFGLADTTGTILDPYLKKENNTGEDGNTYNGLTAVMSAIKEAYFNLNVGEIQNLDPDNYEVVPYVIKHETIGDNVGWYVNFKIELKNTFRLAYDYNEPLGFNYLEHLVAGNKPGAKTVPTHDEDGNELDQVKTKVDSCLDGNGQPMKMVIPDTQPEEVATFVGWSTDANARPESYAKGNPNDNWYDAGEDIILEGDTTLYAIWSTNKNYTKANIQFKKLVRTKDNQPFETEDEFTFHIFTDHDGNGEKDGVENINGLRYAIFTEAGQLVGTEQTFSGTDLTFRLKANQYIMIYDVPNLENGTAQYVIKEDVPDGYIAPYEGVAYGKINDDTNVAGEFLLEFPNQIITYDITFNTVLAVTNPAGTYDPQTVRKGSAISLPIPTPVDNGYAFEGWDTDGNPATVEISKDVTSVSNIQKDTTFRAVWNPIPHEVSYVFEGVPSNLRPSLGVDGGGYGTEVTLTRIATRPHIVGYTYLSVSAVGATTGNPVSITDNKIVMPNEDVIVTLTYQVKSYTISFVDEDGSVLQSGKVEYGATPVYTGDMPTKDATAQYAYTFNKWAPAIVAVTGEATYTATYTAIPRKYTLAFKDDNGAVLQSSEVAYGTALTAPADPTKTGYTFAGWDKAIPDTMPAEDVTITAKWTVNQYTITFVTDGGTEIAPITQDFGTQVTAPANPTKTGYDFICWSPAIPTTMPADNITVKAIWDVATLTLKGSIAHGTVTSPVTVKYGSEGELKFTADAGYVMTGWVASNGQKGTLNSSQQFTWSFSHSPITEDLTVTVFTKPIDYTITYDGMDGATVNPANPVTYHIESGEITLNNPTKPGYIFTGWTGTALTEATMEVRIPASSIGNRAYTANWNLAEYTITYDLNGGSGTSTASTYNIHDTTTMLPMTAVKRGYILTGWKAIQLEGSWARDVLYPAGMHVKGMYGDVTLQAQWTPQEYKITYVLNGGTGPETGTYTIETKTFDLPVPTRNGYVFRGWYEKADFTGSEVTQIQQGSKGDKTFYAKWEVIQYTIRYSGIDGATVNPANPDDYTIASGSITLTKPEKPGYTFQGWTGTGLNGPTMEVTIPTGSTGDRAYTATWSTSIYGAIVCEGDDAVGTIFWNDNPGTAVNSPLKLSGANAMVGAYKNETLTFKPNTGYKIKGVTVNGVAEPANDFTEEGYTYAFDEAGLTEPLKIVVTTEVVSVTVSIVITGASGEPETIEVQEGSDILIAFTPDDGKIHSIQLDYAAGPNDQPSANTETPTGDLSQGYIFTAHQLKQNVTITIDTTTPKIYHAVGVINAGTVELTYGGETVKSTDSTADKYLPLDTLYTLRVNSDTDQGYLIKTVNDEAIDGNPTFYEDSDDELDAGTFTVVAYAEIAEFTLTFYQDDGNIYHTITQNYGTKVTPPDVPQASADPNKSSYVFDGWMDSQNQNAKYISVPSTMPNRDMSFYAKWVDPRLEKTQNVYVGINMSFYMANDSLYYKLPANEPARQYNIHAARVYFAETDRSKWILPAGSWNHPLPGKPTDYISEDIINEGKDNGAVFGIAAVNPDGTVNNDIRDGNLLKLDSDYKNIVQAWLNACRNDQDFRNQYPTANIDWDKLPADPALYDVIPYVIKRHADNNVQGAQAWHIDLIIVPKTKYTVTYDLGDLKGHADYTNVQCPADEIKKYGEGFKVDVASMQDVVNVQDDRYVAKFDGWTASESSVVISDGGKGSFTMPGADVTLTAQWKLPVDFSIEYYKKNPATGQYEKVEADTLNLIGYVGDTPAVSKTYTGYVQKQIENGTVQGKNHVIKVNYDPITYKVVFHANNGTDAAVEQTFTYDLEQNLPANTFTKPGFAFVGWTDGTNEYTDRQLVKNLASAQDAEIHLDAVYTPITLTITQSGMDGQDAGIYVILKDGQEVARVMIKGNSSVTLEQIPKGSYTVREISQNWTWKYAPSAEIGVTVFAHPTQQQNKVTFTLDHKVPVDWLHGEDTN